MLVWGEAPTLSVERFMELCRALMNRTDFHILSELVSCPNVDRDSNSALIRAYRLWDLSLRTKLARLRAAQLKREAPIVSEALADASEKAYDGETAEIAKTALAAASALETETLLDRARWAALDRFLEQAYFSRDVIYAYFLKLRLSTRQSLFTAENGEGAFFELYTSIINASAINASGEAE